MFCTKTCAIVITAIAFISGCAATQKPTDKGGCQYIERNLTVAWQERSYWCVPKGKGAVPRPFGQEGASQ